MSISKLVLKNHIKASDEVAGHIADLISHSSEYLLEQIAHMLLTNKYHKFKYGDFVKFIPKNYVINNHFIISDLKDHNLYNNGYVYAQIIDKDWINGFCVGTFVRCKMIYNTKDEIIDTLQVFTILPVEEKLISFLKTKV